MSYLHEIINQPSPFTCIKCEAKEAKKKLKLVNHTLCHVCKKSIAQSALEAHNQTKKHIKKEKRQQIIFKYNITEEDLKLLV